MKKIHDFEHEIGLNGEVTKNETVKAIDDFMSKVPAVNHGIKIIVIALMAHGAKNDWLVSS